jgi:uncharacterized protein DUF5655
MELTNFFAGHPDAYAVFENVQLVLEGLGAVEVRASKSQVAFRRRGGGFAYLWLPGRYLATPPAKVVLSIALGCHDPSTRFRSSAPPPAQWMHHLEV